MAMRTPRKAAGAALPARLRPYLVPLDPPERLHDPRRKAGAEQPQPDAPPPIEARELWIGAHFPQLALETLAPAPRLERFAVLAQRFTPRVSLVPPDGLLLEVKGSLGLFGGVAKLGASFLAECRALAECQAAGSRPRLALAPTSLAALAGARSGRSFKVTDPSRLIGALAPVPLEVLRWPPETLERLAKVGVRTIGAALRLPRAGFARRFGAETLASLDHLTGRVADLRRSFRAPERFRVRRACVYDLERHEALLAALAPLIESLGRFLEARQCGITRLECRLWHRHAPATRCVLKLAAPAADSRRLSELLGERLAALALPEPVRSCELRSGALVPREMCAESLWQPGEHGGGVRGTEAVSLIETLRARLGAEAVHGLQVHPTHRPEAASRWMEIERVEAGGVDAGGVDPGGVDAGRIEARTKRPSSRPTQGSPAPWGAFRRPLWLLPAPELLSEMNGLPRRGEALRLIGEPERIETGWWEEGATHAGRGQARACPGPTCEAGLRSREVARDYYHAVDAHGVRLWIFREREAPHRWFLQGVFG